MNYGFEFMCMLLMQFSTHYFSHKVWRESEIIEIIGGQITLGSLDDFYILFTLGYNGIYHKK